MSMSSWNPDRPYNDLPPIPTPEELESKPVLRQCIKSRAALAELKQAAELIPNPTMLINTLPVLEARASSEVENIVTTTDDLFEYLHAEERADPATKEALRYRSALMEGFQSLDKRPLSTSTAESVCSRIKDAEMRIRKVPGTKLVNSKGETIYTPPEGETLLRDHLTAWERYIHEERELDPLIRLAAGHYQFEAIHPFTDGNGRTGRILNSLYLVQEDLLGLPILYLSRYIIAHKDEYYRRLIAVTREADWEQWILFMLNCVEVTSRWTTSKIAAIRTLADRQTAEIRKQIPKIYSRELVDTLFEQPYCRIANLVAAGIAQRQAASRHLKRLVDLGFMEEKAVGREKLFINRQLLELLR